MPMPPAALRLAVTAVGLLLTATTGTTAAAPAAAADRKSVV